jgi:hypothetical protein
LRSIPINYFAVFVAALAKWMLGMIWYSPLAFGNAWEALAGRSDADVRAAMPAALAADFIGSLVTAFVLALATHSIGTHTALEGAFVGFCGWLGFAAPASLSMAIYERRPFRLSLINSGFMAISMVIIGAIVAPWP